MKIDRQNYKEFKMGQIVESISKRVDPADTKADIYVGLEHLDPDNIHIREYGKPSDVKGVKLEVSKGDIIFGKRRAYQRKAVIADFDGICSAHAMVLRAKPEVILPELLPFFIHSDVFMNRAIDISEGSLSPTIKWKILKEQQFLLPPIEEQKKLADLLWAGDTVLQRYRELESELGVYMRKYLLSNYQDTNKEKRSFGELFEINPKKETIRSGTTVSFISMSDVSEDGYVENMIEEELENVSSGYKSFIEGDILFAKITPCTENGKGAIAKDLKNGYGFGSTEFHVLRPYEASDRSFIYHISIAPFFRKLAERQMTGSAGQKRVPSEFIDNFKFHIPSPNDRQSIGKYLDHQQESIVKTRRMQNEILRVNKSLINKIFG